MARYVIIGGTPLEGEISISGAKNAAVAILPALRELRIQPSGFSKYCMGMALTDGELKKNCFKPRLRMISKMCRVDYDAPFIIQNS